MATVPMQEAVGSMIHTLENSNPEWKKASSQRIQNPWDDVELTDDETYMALNNARWSKWEDLEKERRRLKALAIEKEVRRPWSAEDHWQHIQLVAYEMGLTYKNAEGNHVMGLKVDDHNKHVLEALCYYFSNDGQQGFEDLGRKHFGEVGSYWDYDKGLYIFGPVGTGKSTTLSLFQTNQRQCFDSISVRKVADAYGKNGADVIKGFSNIKHEPYGSASRFFHRKIGLAFDDLGTEETRVKNYGNEKNVMAEILLNRYENVKDGQFGRHCTHITSNLTSGEIEEAYGPRVKSRFREMFNIIQILGPDRRS